MDNKVYAIISLPNGKVIEGECEDVEYYNAHVVYATIDGKIYRVHSENIVLIEEVKQ